VSGRRCVCGRSASFPLCDGSHTGEDWACETGRASDWAFVAAPSLENLAQRLASAHRGAAVLVGSEAVRCRRLVVLSDGTDLGVVRRLAASVRAERRQLVCLGMPALVAWPTYEIFEVADGSALWQRVMKAIEGPSGAPRPVARRVFLSHASADEATLDPAGAYLRQELGLELFMCSDSIASGSAWHDRIVGALEQVELMLFVLSGASATSTFCAWELGWCMARELPLRVVRIDDTPAPAPIQHLQMEDVGRIGHMYPWFDDHEALLHALMTALAPADPVPAHDANGSEAS